MPLPRLATHAVAGEIEYGAVTDGGIVELSALGTNIRPCTKSSRPSCAAILRDASRSAMLLRMRFKRDVDMIRTSETLD